MLIKNRLSWDFRLETSEKEDPALIIVLSFIDFPFGY